MNFVEEQLINLKTDKRPRELLSNIRRAVGVGSSQLGLRDASNRGRRPEGFRVVGLRTLNERGFKLRSERGWTKGMFGGGGGGLLANL